MISYMQAYYFYELVIHRKWEKKTHQTIHCCEQWNKLAEGEDSTTAQNTPPNTAALQQHYLFCTYIFKALLPCLSMHYTISSFFLGDLHSSPHSAMRSNGSLTILLESQLHSLAHFRERTKNNHKPFLLLEGIFFTSSTFFLVRQGLYISFVYITVQSRKGIMTVGIPTLGGMKLAIRHCHFL